MITFHSLDELPEFNCTSGLTIGSFDGVHLGHQALLRHLRSKLKSGEKLVVLTFANHPSHILKHRTSAPLIISPEHKRALLEEFGVDVLLLIPFTTEFARTSFEQLLRALKEKIHFTHLVLGDGASFGQNREGDETSVRKLAAQLQFEVEYMPKLELNHQVISSALIRALIASGKLKEAGAYLGRPYSIYAPLKQVEAHWSVQGSDLCLPPDGSYPVLVQQTGPAQPRTVPKTAQGTLRIAQSSLALDLPQPAPGLAEQPTTINFQ